MADQISMGEWMSSAIQASVERARAIMGASKAFPMRVPLSLIKRAKADPQHVRSYVEAGRPDRYELIFSEAECEEIEKQFIELKRPQWKGPFEILESQAESFSRMLEEYANYVCMADDNFPDEQEARREKLRQLDRALNRVNELINGMDSAALGFLTATVCEDAGDKSLMNDPPMAMVAAGHLKLLATDEITKISMAAQKAATTLPNYDRGENNPKFKAAMMVDWHFYQNGLPFETKESGFAASCLRAVFELASGEEQDRVKHFLEKAAAHPDSMTAFIARHKKDQ